MLLFAGINLDRTYPDISVVNHSGLLFASLDITANQAGLEKLINFMNEITQSALNQVPIGLNQAHTNIPFAKLLVNPELTINTIPYLSFEFADRLIGSLLYSSNRKSFVLAQIMRVGDYYPTK